MIAFILILLLLVVLGGAAYYYFTQMKSEPTIGPSVGPSGLEVLITEKGATVKENYKMMPKRKGYIQIPQVQICHTDKAPAEWCSVYDKNDGFAYVYDLSLADIDSPKYTSCPDGGHDCWYTEKYNEEGDLISVENKDGESMLQKLVDDIWADKWDLENSGLVREAKDFSEMKDGFFVTTKEFRGINGSINKGEKLKPTDLPTTMYFVGLFTAMKLANMEKPTKITLNIKGARNIFNKSKEGY